MFDFFFGSKATPVYINCYDLSDGLFYQISKPLMGTQLEAMWHSGIVAFGTEYFYGNGIETGTPGQTRFGTPIKQVQLGTTKKSKQEFQQFLNQLGGQNFNQQNYHLLNNNCNNFTDQCAKFLTGNAAPAFLTSLPQRAQSTPQGKALSHLAHAINNVMAQAPVIANDMGKWMDQKMREMEAERQRRTAERNRNISQYADQFEHNYAQEGHARPVNAAPQMRMSHLARNTAPPMKRDQYYGQGSRGGGGGYGTNNQYYSGQQYPQQQQGYGGRGGYGAGNSPPRMSQPGYNSGYGYNNGYNNNYGGYQG